MLGGGGRRCGEELPLTIPGPSCIGGGIYPLGIWPGRTGGARCINCVVALDMVAARSGGACGVALVIVWLRPGGGAPPKMLA